MKNREQKYANFYKNKIVSKINWEFIHKNRIKNLHTTNCNTIIIKWESWYFLPEKKSLHS